MMQLSVPTATTLTLWCTTLLGLGWGNYTGHPVWDSGALGNMRDLARFDERDLIGISKVGDLLPKTQVVPFLELQAEYALAPTKYYRYLQVCQTLCSVLP
ncbi:hypothetical protein NDU88_006686 [Pleurodeles waltl]|uniref:Uncharacterized protein n=1 Tax=Pleurodeles waltl TaxID=8319 RepID=A0AAV7X287_PLEWA|nr:hypothetical protein NDU88_006686 [Pleurodeles waltl]